MNRKVYKGAEQTFYTLLYPTPIKPFRKFAGWVDGWMEKNEA
jgi:hypothetical protein